MNPIANLKMVFFDPPNHALAQKQKSLNRKLLEEEVLFQELLLTLPARRLAYHEKVLNFHRSYRVR